MLTYAQEGRVGGNEGEEDNIKKRKRLAAAAAEEEEERTQGERAREREALTH